MECDLIRNIGRTGKRQITIDKWSLYLRLLAVLLLGTRGRYSFFV
jgi:hypothetical protein